jgi:hypothetical protein
LSWSASTDSGGPGLEGYYVYKNGVLIGTYNNSTNNIMDSCLLPDTTYIYKLASYDKVNDSSALTKALTITTEEQSLEGDLDGDGIVTGHDLSILLSHYGSNYPQAEFDCTIANSSNIVEGHDLSILLSHYGN